LHRRDALKILGLFAAGCAIDGGESGVGDTFDSSSFEVISLTSFPIRRPDDLVVLDVELVNMTRSGEQFVKTPGAAAALVVLKFPLQHVLERPHEDRRDRHPAGRERAVGSIAGRFPTPEPGRDDPGDHRRRPRRGHLGAARGEFASRTRRRGANP
jgi:hypothetical protein